MQFNSVEEVLANDHFRAWYFKNDETKAREWENWLLLNQQYVLVVQESITLMNDLNFREQDCSHEQTKVAFQRFKTALDGTPVVEMRPSNRRWWIPVAAAAVLLVVAGLVYLNRSNNKTTLGSNYGAISQYQLPDGSQVMLNANSKIILDKAWENGKDREVWLKGEAFFKVQKTPAKTRFVVHADHMDIVVTGTQFNVVSRGEESNILLTEGSVMVRMHDGKEILMKPGDFVKVENDLPAKAPADQEKVLAWKQARLEFEKTPMNEVVRVINRHYGVKVNLSDSVVAGKTITGTMPNDNLDVLIKALEDLGEFKITRSKDEIFISDH